jgi:hypothetical protein
VEIALGGVSGLRKMTRSGDEIKRHYGAGSPRLCQPLTLRMVIWAHGDLAGCEQRPEQQRGGSGRGQRGLGLDPALERFLYPGSNRQQLIAFSLMT